MTTETKQADEPMSLRDTIAPKSDQLNYDDLIAGGITVRVVGMSKGSAEQPVSVKVVNAENGKPLRDYRPCKSMRRVLVACWGDQGKDWLGKEARLIGDASVSFGGAKVGGIRISHVSGVSAPVHLMLTTARSKRSPVVIGVIEANKGAM
jgi:hypothetical protein